MQPPTVLIGDAKAAGPDGQERQDEDDEQDVGQRPIAVRDQATSPKRSASNMQEQSKAREIASHGDG